ncbi:MULTISPECIES: lipoprotein NlpI [unclassified Colwellia]|uniref:lipoprotein NlpI n=1 Tax=unclassified Colwellia TaxID=196834 RepID=UPI0015F739C8|nr:MULTISPECIES: lipoprotein NlpI [unclassified Colwellia]MBA6338865.1 lipoprotein NlpI [Colwellia sp. BRX8-7]MBA6355886.1 lipoprotein NlpI [Colwellia sp. BRX8-3]MBA6359511.1 lipoprotein NlpI [Colwellia sp. BRX8-6]MBA6367392.1 lipoprotein NlpI [Colwellia sp. BRX8-5]MBA6373849.1 lipoprotein NlpI [Colwellia sp. BRX8-2]
MNKFFKVALVIVISSLQGCASSPENDDSLAMNQLIIVEPLAINYKSEIAIARLTDVIQRAEITDAQRAELYYDRGVVYDSVGLRSLARLDFNRALRLKPDFVDAYNFLGIHFTQLQEFNQAYEAFDSAIDLAPEHEYAYLNRGIALYYGGRAELSIDDFSTFQQRKSNDPYRILWMYLAESAANNLNAKTSLKVAAEQVEESVWAKNIIQLYLGEITEQEFISQLSIGVNSNKALSERLCEAYFYLGKYYQLKDNNELAANFFKLALSTNVYEFVEHRYAKLELDLMRQEIVKAAKSS